MDASEIHKFSTGSVGGSGGGVGDSVGGSVGGSGGSVGGSGGSVDGSGGGVGGIGGDLFSSSFSDLIFFSGISTSIILRFFHPRLSLWLSG